MERRMAAATTAVLLLCCSVFTSAVSKVDCDYYTATNGDFTVPLNHQLKSSEQLRWQHNGSIIFDRRQNKMLKGKEGDVYQNGSLKLTKVDKSKGGRYTPEVYLDGQRMENLKSIHLCVQDRIKKPRVTFQCPSKPITFTCNVDQPDLNFEWLQNDKVLEKVTGQIVESSGFKGFKTDAFSCRASNQVSSETSEPVKQNCVKTGFVFPEKLLGINTWIFVGGGAGVVVILIVIVVACCIQNSRKRRMQVKEEEELRLGWTNQEQPHHHHNHPPHPHRRQQQQQPAGHTGPRQHRSKQQCSQHHPRGPEHPNGHPQANPRRAAQVPRPVNDDDEQPPPLPQPRKKAPKTPRV